MTRDEILDLVPHAGRMCLLEEVISWDTQGIHCRSRTHRDDDHPLRHLGRLGAVHLVEYGAQTVAVHGGLLAREEGEKPLAAGRLAGLRDIELSSGDMRGVDSALDIRAHRELAGAAGLIYRFTVSADETTLASGRLTIIGS